MGIAEKVGNFLESSRRVFTVSRKPDWEEFSTMAKVTALGIVVIAIVGYIVKMLFVFWIQPLIVW